MLIGLWGGLNELTHVEHLEEDLEQTKCYGNTCYYYYQRCQCKSAIFIIAVITTPSTIVQSPVWARRLGLFLRVKKPSTFKGSSYSAGILRPQG